MTRKYKITNPRRTDKQILEGKKIRHSLDERWNGLTSSEKREVLEIFEKVNRKRLKSIGNDV